MASDPFAFLRGTNHLYWADLGTSPLLHEEDNASSRRTWLCGDAHVENFGSFVNSAGVAVYDLNDFDEAVWGDFQLDVWRMAASIRVLMRVQNVSPLESLAVVVDAFVDAYLDQSDDATAASSLVTAESTAHDGKRFLHKNIVRSAAQTRQQLLDKYTTVDDKGQERRRFKFGDDLAEPTLEERAGLTAAMAEYTGFKVKDVARRLHAGLGSLGVPRFYILIEHGADHGEEDVILDWKWQRPASALLNVPHQTLHAVSARITHDLTGGNHARRAALAHAQLSLWPDAYLGHHHARLHDDDDKVWWWFSIRERSPHKRNLKSKSKLTSVSDFAYMAPIWGRLLAAAHVRAASSSREFAPTATSTPDIIKRTVQHVSDAYAQQVALDHASFVAAWLEEEEEESNALLQ